MLQLSSNLKESLFYIQMFPPNIYPILDDSIIPFSRMTDVASEIIDGGARVIQLRIKRLSSRTFLDMAKKIRRITGRRDVIFIVNDRVDIAILSDADGIHLGQDDMPVNEARSIAGMKRLIIGLSTHNIDEVIAAGNLPVDYISFGPVFPTSTKPGKTVARGLGELAEARKNTSLPIVAIGGIKEGNLKQVKNAGADAVSIISDILLSEDIKAKVRRLGKIVGTDLKSVPGM